MCTNITKALDKCPLQKDCTLIRRVGTSVDFAGITGAQVLANKGNPEFLSSMVGIEFVDNAVMSCASNDDVMSSWGRINIKMFCPKGVKAHYLADISHYGDAESEVLVGRGYHMVIRKAYYDETIDRPVFEVDVLVGSDSDRLTDKQMKELYDKHLAGNY